MQLAIGLGNPGEKYVHTRHNLGFRVVDVLSHRLNIPLRAYHDLCLLGTGHLDHVLIGLAKPLTFMNESGRAAIYLSEQLALQLSELLVICDDANLPLGKIRLRRGGSDGGHRGVASIISHLSSQDFPRLRLGIGSPVEDEDLVTFVLEEFEPQEKPLVTDMIELASEVATYFFLDGIEAAMNRYNT